MGWWQNQKREKRKSSSEKPVAKKRKKKAREEHFSLSTCLQSASAPLSEARHKTRCEEGDESERAFDVVFFPGKSNQKQQHKKE